MFTRRSRYLCHVALAATLAAPALGAQAAPAMIKYASTCRECRVVMTKLATLGSAAEPSSPWDRTTLARDSRGRFFVLAEGGTAVLVYGADGKLLRNLGRVGPGPGEFARPGVHDLAIGRGDTLYVLDRGWHLSVFAPSLEFVRRKRIPGQTHASLIMPDGRVVLNTRLRRPEHAGYPFHLVDRAGELVRPLGPESILLPNQIEEAPEPLATGPDANSVWTVSMNYGIQEWPLTGDRGVAFEFVDVPWLTKRPPPAPRFRRPRSGPPPTSASLRAAIAVENARADSLRRTPGAIPLSPARARLAGIDRAGLIWVLGSYPVPSDKRMAYVLDIIDPRSRQLLVSHSLIPNRWMRFVPHAGLAYAVETDADGLARLEVWSVEVRR